MKKLGVKQQYLLDWFTSKYQEAGDLACGLSEAARSRGGSNVNYGTYKSSADSLVRKGLLREVQIPGKRGMRRGYVPAETSDSTGSALERLLG